MEPRQNIFQSLSQETDREKFSPLIKESKPNKFGVSSQSKIQDEGNVFEQLSKEKPEDNFTFMQTAKDVAEQIPTKLARGAGVYGNIAEMIGGEQGQKTPQQEIEQKKQFEALGKFGKEGESPSMQDYAALMGDDDIVLENFRVPTSKDIGNIIERYTGIGEGKTPIGRVAGRGAEMLGEGLALPGGGVKGAVSLASSGVTGQSLREAGAPESLATTVEIVGSLAPSLFRGKLVPSAKSEQEFLKGARKLGLTENQLTPLLQSETRVATLSKLAKKGEKTKGLFSSIKETLGDSYQAVKSKLKPIGKLAKEEASILESEFGAVRNDLSKTIKPSVDKQAAIDFIDASIDNLRKNGATPEELVNFWQDINKTIKWGSIQGGKQSLSRIKEPILQTLKKVAPEIAGDFEMTNQLYSRYAKIAKKLKPDLVDSFVNKGEILAVAPSATALMFGNPLPLAGLGSEMAVRQLATEMLTNPYFQNIGMKLVKNFNNASAKGVIDLMKNAKDYMKRKYPNEDWAFLIED